ncbi:DUF4184 family protein, partial [Lysinibacillus fusiformis]|uniref:DUF4184 family protein n=1 Tax=Lysinibacillus fusiformis TaxID=28031 RepID=UPI003B974D4E
MFNLPLIIVIYILYCKYVRQHVVHHLPVCLQYTANQTTSRSKRLNVIVFSYSTFLGILTHVIWVSFTHKNG